jgi:hypothetical protein
MWTAAAHVDSSSSSSTAPSCAAAAATPPWCTHHTSSSSLPTLHLHLRLCTSAPAGSTDTSLWTHYKAGAREYCGNSFPDGMHKNQVLATNVITPTTKAEDHDVPIRPQEIVAQVRCCSHTGRTHQLWGAHKSLPSGHQLRGAHKSLPSGHQLWGAHKSLPSGHVLGYAQCSVRAALTTCDMSHVCTAASTDHMCALLTAA